MKGLTHIELVGMLCRDAELRYTPNGYAVLEATVAGEDTPPGADRAFPWYHRVMLYGAFAEALADRLAIATVVYIVGRLEARTWQRSDGGTGRAVDVVASELKVLEDPEDDQVTRDAEGQPRLLTGWNRAVAMGNLTHDASLHDTNESGAVAKLRVAINERTRKGEERTSFISGRAWGDVALEAAQLSKGEPVVLSGRLAVESWKTRDGERRSDTKVEALRIDRVASPGSRPAPAPKPPAEAYDEFPPEEALPF